MLSKTAKQMPFKFYLVFICSLRGGLISCKLLHCSWKRMLTSTKVYVIFHKVTHPQNWWYSHNRLDTGFFVCKPQKLSITWSGKKKSIKIRLFYLTQFKKQLKIIHYFYFCVTFFKMQVPGRASHCLCLSRRAQGPWMIFPQRQPTNGNRKLKCSYQNKSSLGT